MESDIDMGNHKITNLADPTLDSDVVNKKYVDGSRTMKGDLDMGSSSIINLKDPLPSNSHYAATVNFVNKTVSDNNSTISTLIVRLMKLKI